MRLSTSTLHEELRLHDLYAQQILDSPAEREFDELVQLAAHIFGCPIAAITFIDKERTWIKAAHGANSGNVPRNDSFCTHTIQQPGVMVVSDATHDERFVFNPMVTNDPHIRFYAGAPIVSSGGYNLGAICVCDNVPRSLDPQQASVLQIISNQISRLLELRRHNLQIQAAAATAIQDERHLTHNTFLRHEQTNLDISTALHEGLAQGLAAAKLYLEMAEENGDQALVRKAKEHVAMMLDDARSLSKKLAPTTLRPGCVFEMLQHQLARWQQQYGIATQLTCPKNKRLHTNLYLMLYRMVEEQLKNIAAHASATEALVVLDVQQQLVLSISDNGKGFDMERFKAGYGLRTVISAAEYYGGSVDIVARPNGGCTLTVSIPVSESLSGAGLQPQHSANASAPYAEPMFG